MTDFRVCWKCRGLSLCSQMTMNQIDCHIKDCSGNGVTNIKTSNFDYYVCDKADFFALLEIKQSLNKDVCRKLQSRDTASETDVPKNVIESLLKLSISTDSDSSKETNVLKSPAKKSTRNVVGDRQMSDTVGNFLSSQIDSHISSSSSSLIVECDKGRVLNLLSDDEKDKLKRECITIKKGNFEELVCKLCTYQSQSRKVMLRHINSHDNGQAFRCNDCNFTTTLRYKWKMHQCKRQENLQCHCCSQQFTSQSKLNLHLAALHSGKVQNQSTGAKQLQCDCCDYIARDLGSLREHQRKHTGESLLCPHDDCGFKTSYKRSLQKHLQQKHSKVKTQICDVCGFQTRHVASLKKHMKLHQDTKQHKCAECSYASFNLSDVMRHVQRKHLKQKNHSCPKCPFQSGYLLGMKRHMARHERIEADEAKGQKSVKTRSLKYYSCSICGDVMNSMKSAKEHIQKFHTMLEFQLISDSSDPGIEKSIASTDANPISERNMNFDNLLDVDMSSDVLDMASNMLNAEVNRKDNYNSTNVDMSITGEPICPDVFDDGDAKSTVSRKGGNPMLSANSDVLADIDSSLIGDSLFDLMSDLPRPPTLNRCQSASSLMFASLIQPMVDRPLTPDFFTDSPAQSFFQTLSSRSMDQDNFAVGSLNQPFQIDLTATSTRTNKPLSPVLQNFTCFSTHHSASQGSLALPSSEETVTAITECLL